MRKLLVANVGHEAAPRQIPSRSCVDNSACRWLKRQLPGSKCAQIRCCSEKSVDSSVVKVESEGHSSTSTISKKEELSVRPKTHQKRKVRQGTPEVEVDKTRSELLKNFPAEKEPDRNRLAVARSRRQERRRVRAEELVAIRDTIKLLNDDGRPELFKASLPSTTQKQPRYHHP